MKKQSDRTIITERDATPSIAINYENTNHKNFRIIHKVWSDAKTSRYEIQQWIEYNWLGKLFGYENHWETLTETRYSGAGEYESSLVFPVNDIENEEDDINARINCYEKFNEIVSDYVKSITEPIISVIQEA
jgi:hypothetical protein